MQFFSPFRLFESANYSSFRFWRIKIAKKWYEWSIHWNRDYRTGLGKCFASILKYKCNSINQWKKHILMLVWAMRSFRDMDKAERLKDCFEKCFPTIIKVFSWCAYKYWSRKLTKKSWYCISSEPFIQLRSWYSAWIELTERWCLRREWRTFWVQKNFQPHLNR